MQAAAAQFEQHQQEVASLAEWRMLDAIGRGDDLPLQVPGSKRTAPVSEYLGECHEAARALLFRACHLAQSGKYEAAVKELLAFSAEVARQYGEDRAEVA